MSTTDPASQSPLHLRVFLASPGDVADERALALKVLEQLEYDPFVRGRITVETVAWDKPGAGVPMLATLTPQEAIAKGLPNPADCDIVIVIFWSRMGTLLPANWEKIDGSRYLSGTEWEYRNALEAAKKRGKPDILVYRRTEKVTAFLGEPDYEAKNRQWNLVEEFFSQSFTDPDGSNSGGYKAYATPTNFQEQLYQDLRSLVQKRLEHQPVVVVSQPPQPALAVPDPPPWPGSPFPGLRAFTADDEPIFFGRGQETDALLDKLRDPKVQFLAVVGASGSGKSSLVAAGLLPRLAAGALPGSQNWIYPCFKPADVGDNPFMALAQSCKNALPARGPEPREWAEQLVAQPTALIELRDRLLDQRLESAEVLLFVDQFEELFTSVAPDYIKPFIAFLNQVAQTARLRIVVTLRADFYHRCVELQPLAELLRAGSFPLAAPGSVALNEMITRPAERAGLSFEQRLVQRLLDDTGAEPGALALLAFALAQWYDQRTPDGRLTLAAYDSFQGVSGAIGRRAEDTLQRLKIPDDTTGTVFQELVDVTDEGAMTRRRVLRARPDRSADAQRLVDELITARLLVAGQNANGQPVVDVAHEKLFTAWPALRDWIETHREQIQAGNALEKAAEAWENQGKPWSELVTGARLKRYRQAGNPSPLAQKFLRASGRRLWLLRGTAGILVTVLLIGVGWLQGNGMAERLGLMLIDAIGLSKFKEPEMIAIRGGEFWMGSADDDREADSDEKPHHVVTIADFEISKYEVTFEEYDLFASARGRLPPSDQGWGRGRRPVINVSWDDAVVYVAWLSRKTGKKYRLPTEAEWEYAARAGTKTKRFWGDDPNLACRYANVADESFHKGRGTGDIHACDDKYAQTAEVGSFEANAFGLHDMLGNVWEWTCSVYEEKYNGQEQVCVSNNHTDSPLVIRGGAWSYEPHRVRGAVRYGSPASYRYDDRGFRLAI